MTDDPSQPAGDSTPSANLPPTTPPAAAEKPAAPEAPTPETLKAAFKAFKKRLKVTQLDHNSRVGKSPMSSGSSELTAMSPPGEYPKAVWQALVDQGKLKYIGHGMYEIRTP